MLSVDCSRPASALRRAFSTLQRASGPGSPASAAAAGSHRRPSAAERTSRWAEAMTCSDRRTLGPVPSAPVLGFRTVFLGCPLLFLHPLPEVGALLVVQRIGGRGSIVVLVSGQPPAAHCNRQPQQVDFCHEQPPLGKCGAKPGHVFCKSRYSAITLTSSLRNSAIADSLIGICRSYDQ